MAKSLFERIQAALQPHARAADVATLIGEVEIAVVAAEVERDTAQRTALSASSDEATAEAAADAEVKAARRITRLGGQLTALQGRHQQLLESERRKRADAERTEIVAQRDALAAEIATEWPVLAARMAELLRAIEIDEVRCRRAGVDCAEYVARKSDPEFIGRRLHQAVIPVLRREGGEPDCHWPRIAPHIPGQFCL